MAETLEQQLQNLQEQVEKTATEKAKSEIKKEMNTLVIAEVEKAFGVKTADALKAMMSENEDVKGLKQWKIEKEKADEANQKWIDEQIAKGKTIVIPGDGSYQGSLRKALETHKDSLKSYTKSGRRALQFELDNFQRKTVGNIGSSNFTVSGTQGFVAPAMFFEPGRTPYEQRHVRDVFRVVPQGEGTDVYVIRDSAGEGGPTTVSAGSAKPQSDRDWVKTVVPITKIAHYYKIPEEYLADIVWLQDEITGVGVEELLAKEDTLLLTNSSAGEFKGLNQTFNSTAFSASAAGMANSILKTTNYDVLVAAWTHLRNLKVAGSGVLMHPTDYGKLLLTKDTTGQYILGAPNATLPNLYGMPIIAHTAVTSGKYFLGDFSKGKIGQRAGLSVRFYDQNEDDAIKNMVTVVIEERITFAMDRADRCIYGDFLADASAISASY
jgi:HK97 family phage major capsid protein